MNNYRRFKYPFGGETPQEFADARRAYYENESNTALQAINAAPVVNANTVTQPFDETSPREYLRQYTERVRPEVERRVNEMNRRPSGNGRIIRNHDKLYDYYKDGDKLYYRKKGGKNWIDISDNDVAQKRINATIARNKRSYGKPKTSSSQNVEDNTTYDAGTLNDVVVTGTRRNTPSSPRRVQGSTAYKATSQTQEDRYRKGKPGYIITRGAQKAIDFVRSLANKERNNNSNGYISRSQYMAKYHRDRLNQK